LKVDSRNTYIDTEDEMIAVSVAIRLLDKKFKETSARWMWLPSEWGEYVVKRSGLQKRLRKLKAELGYNDTVAD
jgi:hypothetical protein